MGAYILTAGLCMWVAAAFALGDVLIHDAVDAFSDADPVNGNLPLCLILLTIACIIAFPRILFDALVHYITITCRR